MKDSGCVAIQASDFIHGGIPPKAELILDELACTISMAAHYLLVMPVPLQSTNLEI